MKRALTEAKLQCRFCQTVFVGSTRLAPEVLPPEITLPVPVPHPAEAEFFPPASLRRRPVWPAGLTLLGLAAAAVLGAWLYHHLRGGVLVRSPVGSPAVASRPVARTPANTVASPAGTASPAPAAGVSSPRPKADGPSVRAVEILRCAPLEGPDEASATFVGAYENRSPHVLRWVRIAVTVARADGKIAQVSSEKYENIPPGWRGHFSIDAAFRFEPSMRIAAVEARSDFDPQAAGWAPPGGWNLEVTDEGAIHLTGETANPTRQTLEKLIVWCDFFTKQGVYVGSAQGTFRRERTTLAPGETVVYDLHFDPREAGCAAPLLAEPRPRFVGTFTTP